MAVDAMVVTPICPHLLTLRPIVVRGDACVTVRAEDIPHVALLTVDGQSAVQLQLGDEIRKNGNAGRPVQAGARSIDRCADDAPAARLQLCRE